MPHRDRSRATSASAERPRLSEPGARAHGRDSRALSTTTTRSWFAALERTADEVAAWLDEVSSDDDPARRFAVSLLEHEAQHHDQLIDRYALEPE